MFVIAKNWFEKLNDEFFEYLEKFKLPKNKKIKERYYVLFTLLRSF